MYMGDQMKGIHIKSLFILMPFLLIIWGSFAAVSKLTMKHLDSFQIQFYMFGFSAIAITIILYATGRMKHLKGLQRKELISLVLMAIPSYLYYFTYTLSLKKIPAIEASMLNYLFPIMIVIFAVPINREKLDTKKIISVVLGFIGMMIIITNGKFTYIRLTNFSGDMFAIGAAISWGLFSNVAKKNKIDTIISIYIFTLVSFSLSIVSVVSFSKFAAPATVSAIAGLAWIGISNIVLANFIWFKILKSTSASVAANLAFITPFVSILFIAILLGEKITFVQTIGFLVIMISNALQSFDLKNASKSENI
jgi:drug/metabolite transporter (DMT)-like permease